jgi:CRP/FNR family transcriptional regulator
MTPVNPGTSRQSEGEPARRAPLPAVPGALPQLFSSIDPCGDCPAREDSICGVLDPSELAQMAAITRRIRMRPQDTLFSEGQPADDVFNITSGMVKLYKLLPDGRRQITGLLGMGDFLGMALGDTYAYSAEALTEGWLCRFRRTDLEARLIQFPQLQRRLFTMASNELRAAQDQMLLLGRKTAVERLCSFLLMLSRRAVLTGQKASPILLPMTRGDIADYLGLTIETVSRTLTRLKAAGLIAVLPGNKLRLDDPAALEAAAGAR